MSNAEDRARNEGRLKALGGKVRAGALRGADLLERGLRRFYAAVRRKVDSPVRVHRKKDVLTIVDAPRIGGAIHILSLPQAGDIRVDGVALVFGGNRVSYGDEATAQAALQHIKQSLIPAGWGVWLLRLMIALLVIMVVRGALIGMSAAPANGSEQAAAAGAMQGMAAAMATDPSFIPPEPLPQLMPGTQPVGGELAERIYQQSMAAAQQAEHQAMPAQPAATSEGLEGFGLQDGQAKNGAGCDPALAFQVSEQ